MSFSAGKQPFCLKQQAEHDQAEPEVVRFGQRVQAAERVGKPQQPDRPCQEEEGAGADRQNGQTRLSARLMPRPPPSGRRP